MNPRNWEVMAILVSLERESCCSVIGAPTTEMWAAMKPTLPHCEQGLTRRASRMLVTIDHCGQAGGALRSSLVPESIRRWENQKSAIPEKLYLGAKKSSTVLLENASPDTERS